MSKPLIEEPKKPKAVQDPEILAMSRIFRILKTLDCDTAERVSEYVANKCNQQARKFVPDGND